VAAVIDWAMQVCCSDRNRRPNRVRLDDAVVLTNHGVAVGAVFKGSTEVREFYDSRGWMTGESGNAVDQELFGNREDGEIRRAADACRIERIRNAYARRGDRLNLIECGCGGNPALFLTDLCSSYTGVDFSSTGLAVASSKLASMGNRARVVAADICSLPFKDGEFDAAYSAHVLYHIPSSDAQGRAFDEIMRIVRPGGVAVFILANPRPLLFPARLAKRLIADIPALGRLANRMRRNPLLPYRPMTLRWMRQRLERFAKVQITCNAMASTWVNQHVSERRMFGRKLWHAMLWIEREHPVFAARMGNYVQITALRE
jgi:ubiquinone/menaquinone biosynthesis C-methylase UbiE